MQSLVQISTAEMVYGILLLYVLCNELRLLLVYREKLISFWDIDTTRGCQQRIHCQILMASSNRTRDVELIVVLPDVYPLIYPMQSYKAKDELP